MASRSLLTLGASLLSARAKVRLGSTGSAVGQQEKVFKALIPRLAAGSVWWDAGIEATTGYETFRKIVPLSTHEDMAPHVERMRKGEPDVLWPGPCQIYARTTGTTTGAPRRVPVTEAMLDHFKRTYMDSLLWYTVRARRCSVFRGKHLMLGGSTALAPIVEAQPFEAYDGDMSAIAALNLPSWAERAFREPSPEIAQIADWEQKLAAIAASARSMDITLLAGMPRWALTLAASVCAGSGMTLSDIWPELECYLHGGVPVSPFQDRLRAALGPSVQFQEVYSAPEAFIAEQDLEAADGLRLMSDAGVFFEFLPMSEFGPEMPQSVGQKALPLSGVQTGVDYALIVTTPGGFVRFLLGDIVQFTSLRPPRLVYVGRTALRLDSFGEKVDEKDITDAFTAVCRRNGWTIVNFHVAPLFNAPLSRTRRGRHEWWVELLAGTQLTPTGPVIAPELDAELLRTSPGYAAKRRDGTLEAPFVRLVMPGVFEHWMRYHGKWGGNNKMPRCRDDRSIADELGAALQFAKD